MAFELPPLPFDRDALVPVISPETIDYRNARARYVEAFWQLVDWGAVAASLARRSGPPG